MVNEMSGQYYQPVSQVYNEMLVQKVLRDRVIVLNDEVNTESIYQVTYWMDKIKKKDDFENLPREKRVITIEISSPGGSCVSGFFLCSKILKFINEYGYEIITRVNEYACSMGFMIFVCGSRRQMFRFSEIMFHQPLSASWEWDKLQELEDRVENLTRMWKQCKQLCLERTKMTDKQMETCKKEKHDWYMNIDEAITLGVATERI